jgi:hypothetical protein
MRRITGSVPPEVADADARGAAGADGGHELDALLRRAMAGILAALEAGFDAETGLADVYGRWRALCLAQGLGREPDGPGQA